MGHYQKTFRVEASPQRLWELMSDPDRLPEWNGAFDRIEDVTGPLDEVGTTYTQVMRVAGIELTGHWEITEVEPTRRRRFQGTPPGCAACTGSETFETVEGGTDYTVEMDYTLRGGPFGVALDRLFGRSFVERVVERNIEVLRGIVEG
jgi:uncharacterized protein YndB with AHSA1/START domain